MHPVALLLLLSVVGFGIFSVYKRKTKKPNLNPTPDPPLPVEDSCTGQKAD